MTPRVTVTALLVAATLSACAAPPPPEEVGASLQTVTPGVLTACVATTPRLVSSTGFGPVASFEGFDVDVLEHVAGAFTLPLELVEASYDDLVSGVALSAGRCDLAAGGIVADAGLDGLVQRSAPYRAVDRLVLAAPTVLPGGTDPAAITLRVGVEDSGPAEDAVAALTSAEIVRYPSGTDLERGMASGEVQAVLVAAPEAAEIMQRVPTAAVGARVPTRLETVLLFPSGVAPEFVAAVDAALAELRASPAYDELIATWLEG